MGYANEQITLAVKSLGFEQPDVDFTLQSLEKVFSYRCSPATAVIPPEAGPKLQSICGSSDCPLDPNATCSAYPDDGVEQYPVIANASLVGSIVKENDTASAAASGAASLTSAAASASSSSGAEITRWVESGSLFAVSVGLIFAAGLVAFPV